MEGDDNQELQRKFGKNDSFNREMLALSNKYKQLEQQIFYSPQQVNPAMIVRLDAANEFTGTQIRRREDLFVINGQYQPSGEQSYERFLLQLVQSIPRPKSPFGFIYVNNLAEGNAYSDFRKVLEMLPSEFLLHLTKIYVIEASFFNRALTFLSFGTVTNYLKNKTVNVETLQQLSQEAKVDLQLLTKILPKNVVASLSKVEEQTRRKNLRTEYSQNIELNSPSMGLARVKSEEIDTYSPVGWEQIKGSSSTKKHISDYQVGPSGAPIILEMLIYFFSNSNEALKLEGLFRKSVVIDEERELVTQLSNQNYNYLSTVTDPHLIANGIKRFLSSFREPVIPYKAFDMLMEADGEDPHYVQLVVECVRELPKLNRMTLFFLIDFLRSRVLAFQSQNRMTETNLCIVFGPCLMHSEVSSIRELLYAKKVIVVTSILFKQFETIFGNEGEQTNLRRNSYEEYRKEESRHREQQNMKEKQEKNRWDVNEDEPSIKQEIKSIIPKQFNLSHQQNQITKDKEEPSTHTQLASLHE